MDDDAQATALISAATSVSASASLLPAASADGDDATTPMPPSQQKEPRRPLTAATTSNTSSRRLADNSAASLSYMSGASITSSSRFLTTTTMTAPPSTLSSFASSHNSQMSGATSTDDESGAEYTDGDGKRRPKWWKRMVTMRSAKRPRRNEQQILIDQELYVRSILESYSSSLSSNRMSSSARYTDSALAGIGGGDLSPHPVGGGGVVGIRDRGVSTEELTSEEAMYLAQLETPNQFELDEEELQQIQNQRTIGVGDDEDDHEARNRRRIQRRITKEALRAKQLEKSQHLARTRKKLFLFMLCIGMTLSGFIVAAVMIAKVGIDARTTAANNSSGKSNSTDGSNSTVTAPTPTPVTATPTPVTTLAKDNPLYESLNGTLPPRTARSGISLIGSSSQDSSASGSADEGETGEDDAEISSVSRRLYTYVHCVLMSLSLWMSLVVIGMHITFRSFRTYSLPLVLELSFVQCGYWITSLLRVQFVNESVDDIAYLFFCMAESFFNFGQISFTCAIAFNMYRSVVSYADVLLDSHSAKQRYRTYTVNVMLLSLLGSVTLSLVGYRKYDTNIALDNFQPCLYPTCRLILYVYYPLLAFGFNFIFYIRFKRTIGESYPISATGRLNKVARSYLVLFFICWGSLITLTGIQSPDPDRHADEDMQLLFFILQSIFDVLGVGTAVITLTNFHRCRKAFDFGLSLKTIDPHNIEFEDPVNILGEGTFALVLKAKWHQGVMENSISRTVDVAVKTFKHTQFECLDQMKEEAYLSSKLMHPCVMMTYGCYTSGSNLYIVYEFLGGGTLQDVLDANASLPYETVLRYAHMIAMGMQFLHGLPVPIIHRDLKPLNCIFDSDQEMLKVADFGESRLFQKNEVVKHQRPDFYPSADLTLQMTTNIGSACWAAPEVLKDEATSEYSVKVDVYSFGIMCWQLYTCKIPYVDIPGSVLALSEAVLGGHRPEIPEDCPTLFAKIMRRCWHESAPRRPNFEDIVQLLEMELADERRRQSLASYAQPLVTGGHLRRKADLTSMMSSTSSQPHSSEATRLFSTLQVGAEEATSDSLVDEAHENATSAHHEAAETRIYSGEGSHTIQVQVGGQTRELIIDTGSGKTAFICEGCHDCGDSHSNAPFRFTDKTKYLACDVASSASTESELASVFSFGLKKPTLNTCKKCVDKKCEYSQTYVEGDYWVAYKVSDEMQFAQNQPEFKSNVEFGCIYKQDGVFNLQTSDGIMGFSKHPDSIFEQFYRNKVTKSRIFSQCLGTQGGMLTLGGVDLSINYDPKVMYTPIRDTGYQYWTVTLLSIQVGSVPMDVDSQVYNKERGCVFDSGTTFLYLPSVAEEPFKEAWRKAVGNAQFPISSSYYTLSESEVAQFPSICFLFLNDAKLCMKPELYFYRMSPGRFAGTVSFGGGAKSTIIGASALTNYNVIYDIDNSRIGFARANCEASVRSSSGGMDDGVAMVELSLNPGGDTFRSVAPPLGDSNGAIQWVLVAATFFGVAGLMNALWMELKSVRAARALEAEIKKTLEAKKKDNGKQQQEQGEARNPKVIDSPAVSFDEEDTVSAFSFILMHDDDDDQHAVNNQDFGHK